MHKIVKNMRGTEEFECKLYCFPDISSDRVPDVTKGKKGESRFHPLQFTENFKPSSSTFGAEPQKVVERQTDQVRDLENQAYARGFTDGERAGRVSEKQQLEPVLKLLRQALFECNDVRRRLSDNLEKEVVQLAMVVARKVILHESAVNKQVIMAVVKEALLKAVDYENIRIRVNPHDLEYLQDADPHLFSDVEKIQTINLINDGSLMSGGCIIETDFGIIDARIEQQLQVIEEALTTELQEPSTRD